MHLLAAQPGAIFDGTEAVDLGQTPGDIVVLSAADTELSLLARARARIEDEEFPSLRLASLLHLGHNMSVDLYVDTVICHAKLVVVRLLGGRSYWPYGVDEVLRTCCDKNIHTISKCSYLWVLVYTTKNHHTSYVQILTIFDSIF